MTPQRGLSTSFIEQVKSKTKLVIIGASAGGIEALQQVLPCIPSDSGVATVCILHLSPEKPSMLAEIFAPRLIVEVIEASDKEPILPARVYFAPPDYHLLFEDHSCIALSSEDPVNFSRPSIDVGFESAANVFRESLLGILLTGANQDGALGLKEIVRCGGQAIVQVPETAAVSTMPAAGLRAEPKAVALSLDEICKLIRDL